VVKVAQAPGTAVQRVLFSPLRSVERGYSAEFTRLKDTELFLLSIEPELRATEAIILFLEQCARFRDEAPSSRERLLARKIINFWSDFLRRKTGYLPVFDLKK
jgi:hypothetical protein